MIDDGGLFKNCNVCGAKWYSLREYLADTKEVCKVSEMGLALRNCKCGTTLGMTSEETYPEQEEYYKQLWETEPKYWLVKSIRSRQNEQRKNGYSKKEGG